MGYSYTEDLPTSMAPLEHTYDHLILMKYLAPCRCRPLLHEMDTTKNPRSIAFCVNAVINRVNLKFLI